MIYLKMRSLQTSEARLKLWCWKIWKAIKAIPFALINRSNLNPTKNRDSFNFVETQELLLSLIYAPKRADIEVFMKYFCLMIDEKWIFLADCDYFKV